MAKINYEEMTKEFKEMKKYIADRIKTEKKHNEEVSKKYKSISTKVKNEMFRYICNAALNYLKTAASPNDNPDCIDYRYVKESYVILKEDKYEGFEETPFFRAMGALIGEEVIDCYNAVANVIGTSYSIIENNIYYPYRSVYKSRIKKVSEVLNKGFYDDGMYEANRLAEEMVD